MAITKNRSVKSLNLSKEFPKFNEADETQKLIIKNQVGSFIVQEINRFLDGSNSPVGGQGKLKNKKDGEPSQLLERGTMRSFIDHEDKSTNVIDIGIFADAPERERLKAFNHNVGDTLPQRQFIPDKDESFKKQINTGIRAIIDEVLGGS